jgi:hypothetical protein
MLNDIRRFEDRSYDLVRFGGELFMTAAHEKPGIRKELQDKWFPNGSNEKVLWLTSETARKVLNEFAEDLTKRGFGPDSTPQKMIKQQIIILNEYDTFDAKNPKPVAKKTPGFIALKVVQDSIESRPISKEEQPTTGRQKRKLPQSESSVPSAKRPKRK